MRILLPLVQGCYALIITFIVFLFVLPQDYSEDSVPTLQFTVVAPVHEAATGTLAPFGPGFERDLVAEFCKNMQCDVRWVQATGHDEALELLRQGKADVAVGFQSDDGPAHRDAGVVMGPVYSHGRQVEIYASAARMLDARARAAQDADAPNALADAPALPSLESVNLRLDSRSWALWQPFAVLRDKEKAVETNGDGGAAGDDGQAAVAANFHWAWSLRNPSLNERLRAFWQRLEEPRDTTLARLEDRYYGYLPESVNPYSVADLMYILQRRLPRYSSVIARASDRADINPLLFTAVIIQESRLDESTVSHTGVRGIMQLTQNTAEYLKVDRMDPVAAIGAGARYLRMLWKDLEPLELDTWDRWFFTLAAFNQGPRRLEGAMELSRKLGGTGRTWSELKAVYPLLTQKKYAAMVGQSVCRGQEAVDFVERVRMSYHILRGLVALEWPEAQNLAPLLRGFDVADLGF